MKRVAGSILLLFASLAHGQEIPWQGESFFIAGVLPFLIC